MVTQWNDGVWFNAGMYDGQISQYMGLVPNSYPNLEEEDTTRNWQAPAQMMAGWLYGISLNTVDIRNSLLACY